MSYALFQIMRHALTIQTESNYTKGNSKGVYYAKTNKN